MNSTSNAKQRRRQRGTQLVEFAVVLPLLVLLTMMIIEAGFFIRAHQVINNAAREAAHVASLYQGRDYIDTATQRNALGFAAACAYVNQHQSAFPGWTGDSTCGEPFNIVVQDVDPADPAAIIVDGVNMASTRALVRYRYTLKYVPLSFFGWTGSVLDLQGHAQFRN